MSCESCHHERRDHGENGDEGCKVKYCGCYGYFRPRARYCDNPNCGGDYCTENRPQPATQEKQS